MSDLIVNAADLKTYMHVVFSSCSGFIPLRSFAERDTQSKPYNIWIKSDDDLLQKAKSFADYANKKQAGFFVIPGTVKIQGQARADDIVEDMELVTQDGEVQQVLPTHYIHHELEKFLPIENPNIWVVYGEESL